MVDYFPDYKGGKDVEAGRTYVRNRFVSLHRDKSSKVYSHFTCATQTDQVKGTSSLPAIPLPKLCV